MKVVDWRLKVQISKLNDCWDQSNGSRREGGRPCSERSETATFLD
jgi:hypothetical protein